MKHVYIYYKLNSIILYLKKYKYYKTTSLRKKKIVYHYHLYIK